jgi:hypothetical protein
MEHGSEILGEGVCVMANKIGPTGKFPKGKLNSNDEGELVFGIANDGKLVHVNFGKPVAWFAIPPDLALKIASNLQKHALLIMRSK